MRSTLSKNEALLTTAFAALLAFAIFGPSLAQPEHYHAFADQRTLGAIPHALDVLSNLPFAMAGVFGLYCLWAVPARTLGNVQRAMAALFFAGLLLTAGGSSWYHWAPDDAGLAIDRNGMGVAFAGLLGLAAAGRVSERAGAALGLALLLLAPFSIRAWSVGGTLLPWAVLQFGGAALLAWLAVLRPRYWALDIRWLLVIAAYASAKVLEMGDHEVYRLTGEWVSGHTLKHLLAALAAGPVITALFALRGSRHNALGAAVSRSLSANAYRISKGKQG
jgi:hypothetical protein